MTQIDCRDLKLGYDKKIIAENITFKIDEGDYLCIVGENGVGKSTLVKTLLGLNKPLCGEIRIGENIRQRDIGYLPQQAEVQRDFPATVWEIVLSGNLGRRHGRLFFGKEEKQLAYENIKKLGILDLKNESYRQLSGGQQQRVLLARALCAAQKILLLDEPASGLDPLGTSELYGLIKEINEKENITVVMVSHDIQAAAKFAKHILHLGNGEMFFGAVDEYIKNPISREFLNFEKGV